MPSSLIFQLYPSQCILVCGLSYLQSNTPLSYFQLGIHCNHQCPFQTWHKLDCVVPNGIHETKEICIAEQHQTYPLHLSQAYCPDTGQMPSVLVLFLSRFLLDYLLPSYPSLGIFIWTWNFLSIPGKVRGTPRRRSNGSTCPSGRSWAIEGNFIVYVPAF